MPATLPKLVLASGSPRRRQILEGLGLRPEVRPADVDETPLPGEGPVPYVERLARLKARARGAPGELVLAADTIVALGDELLGKPRDEAQARRMLRRLADREHRVATGVALYRPAEDDGPERLCSSVTVSNVLFTPLSDRQIAWYVATGEPLDKAGAYGIQGLGALFVESIEGNYGNIVGLPLPATARLFEEMGSGILEFREG